MAGSLGQAIFEISLDTGGMKAELDHAKKLAASAGKQIRSEFELDKKISIVGLDDRIRALKKEQEGVVGLADRYDQLEKEIKDVVKVRKKLASSKFDGPKAGSLGALDAREQSLRKEIRQVEIGSKKYKALAVEIRKASGARAKADKAISGQGFGIGKQIASFAAAAVSIGALTAGLSGAISKAMQLEKSIRVLENTLGTGGAAASMEFLRSLSSEMGVELLTLSKTFGKFSAAATGAKVPLEQQKELFKAVTTTGVQLGMSNEDLRGSFYALQQMASKGVVSMEELRRQLGERMPVAFAAAADGLGITSAELNDLVSSGKLAATDFFPAFTKGLKNLSKGANTTKTSAQKLQVFSNKWSNLQIAIGKNLLPLIVEAAQKVGDAFQWAADNLSTLIAATAGLGAAVIAFNAVALSTMAAASAQAALAAAAAVAQVILNPANAMKVAAAMAIGAGVAIGLKVALDEAAKSQAG
ncbi:MAG: tape measure protein, partial [Prochlorococcaceae cyanobacterium ETNP18_MAG_17]|nr:tape measure protein [Prochlorococcaceae cyanobacterium ETNP18_MAG_17]